MSDPTSSERAQLEQAINALEAQRALLGDVVVNVALAPLREKLAALNAPPAAPPAQQRKQVTVLFADVSGFTAMSETMDAEEVTSTMNALWGRLDRAILHHGGTIDKHIGDAVMALFGAPTAHEDDPERAIRAALDMQAELRAFTSAPNAPRLAMRIGLNTGPVLLGNVGITGEYTAMGDAVNVASRLEHAAPVGGILISHDTYRHVRGVFTVAPQTPLSVKGKSEPIQTYVVLQAKPRAFRVTTRGIEGVETRTIGREAELAQLQQAFETAVRENATQLVSVVAEAGTGKSRLLYEFHNWLDLQPLRLFLFKGRATQDMQPLPYSLLRDVLVFRFDIHEGDRAGVARQKLVEGLLDFAAPEDEDALMRAHFIGHLLGFDFSDSPYLQGILSDARQIHDRAFHYFTQFFKDVTRDRPTTVMLEDIHWADSGSLDFIDYLLREEPGLPLVVTALTRPTIFEDRPTWGQGPSTHVRIDLRPLTEAQCRQLIGEILQRLPVIPRELEALILQRAEGSPFYIEELIKMLIEDGVIHAEEEQWSVALDRLASARVPATLTGVIQARLDGLPPKERDTLQQAAVVGRVFWSNILERLRHPEAAQPDPADITHARLRALTNKELIAYHDEAAGGTPEYLFRHAILHDVTYESVLRRFRKVYHAQVAESLIAISGERVEEYAGRIGEHFEQAGELARAAEWYWRAGQSARETYAPEAAVAYFRRALDFLKEAAAQPGWRFELMEALGDVLDQQAQHTEAIEAFQTLLAEAQTAGQAAFEARAWIGIANAQGNQGDHRQSLESALRAEALARTHDLAAVLVRALFQKGRTVFRLGRMEEALALSTELTRLTEAQQDQPQLGSNAILLGAVHYTLGDYDQAVQCFESARAVFQALNDRRRLMDVSSNLGVLAHARGDYDTALQYTEEALTIAVEIGERDGELVFTNNLGAARVGLGDFVRAEVDLHQVIALAGGGGSWVLPDTYRLLAEALLGQGKTAPALTAAKEALTLARAGDAQEWIGKAWRVLGQVAAAQAAPVAVDDRTWDAEACFAEGLRVFTEGGMEGGRAAVLKEWAAYALQHGQPERGAAMWREAREIFGRLGATQEVARMGAEPQLPGQTAGA